MMVPVAFAVFGDPSPQAGMRSVPIHTKTGPLIVNGRVITRQITTGGVNLKSWRQEVAAKASEAAAEHGMFTGPVKLDVEFRFSMPASRPQWAKAQGILLKVSKPDKDKLIRAIGDSLTAGGLLKDDALIALTNAAKVEVWESWTGAMIRVTPLDQRTFRGLLPS
jgi:Holliday junction resolvase RusA-like endonuclease